MLSDEMRELLLHGPGRPPSHANLLKYGGSATLLVQWRKHRQELLDACPIGSRPWAFFAIERRFRVVPRLEADQLRAIRTLGCYRDEAEAAYVRRRLGEMNEEMHARRHLSRVA